MIFPPIDSNNPKRQTWLSPKFSKKQRLNFYVSFLKETIVDLRPLIYLSVFLHILFWPQRVSSAESTPEFSARALDSLLQDYAFRALVHPITGAIYDGEVPCNLTGVKIAAMRMNSFMMKELGIYSFKEIHIPRGVIERPSATKVVLVYQNLENWSELYYPLPGYTYLAPVLGFLVYNGRCLLAKNLPELDIEASKQPILIKFENLKQVPKGLILKCVHFGLDGAVEFGNVIDGNVCSSIKQGHFSIVVEYMPPPSPPSPPPSPASSPPPPVPPPASSPPPPVPPPVSSPPPSPPPPVPPPASSPPPSPPPPVPPPVSPPPPSPPPPVPPPVSPPPPSPPPPVPPPVSPPPPSPPETPDFIPSPAPSPAPESGGDKKGRDNVWGTIGYVSGGFLLFMLIGVALICLQNYREETSVMYLCLHTPYFNVIQTIDGVNENVTLVGDGSTEPLLENDKNL